MKRNRIHDPIRIHSLITAGGLNYCCEWMFFALYKNNRMVADRLGVSIRAVQEHRGKAAKCTSEPRCMTGVKKMLEEKP